MLRIFPFTAATAIALASASAAPATIVPQKGIAGARIGMTQGKVRSVLGKPVSVQRGSNDFGKYTIFKYGGLQVMFQGNGPVTGVSTTRRSERTAAGSASGRRKRR